MRLKRKITGCSQKSDQSIEARQIRVMCEDTGEFIEKGVLAVVREKPRGIREEVASRIFSDEKCGE